MHNSIHRRIENKGRSRGQDGVASRQSGVVVVRMLDLHGEAGAGVQRAAAVRMTVRAAAEIFMVPRGRGCGRGMCCLRILCRGALQLRQTFYREPGQQRKCPPPARTGGVSTKDTEYFCCHKMKTHKMEKKTEITFGSMTLLLTVL